MNEKKASFRVRSSARLERSAHTGGGARAGGSCVKSRPAASAPLLPGGRTRGEARGARVGPIPAAVRNRVAPGSNPGGPMERRRGAMTQVPRET